ncbi:MAG: serine hydrolase domain-containing protein, partial [Ferruginibacter sp.]
MKKLLLIFLLFFNKVHSQEPINSQKIGFNIDSIFKPFVNSPGLGIGIVADGKLVVNKNFGLANLDYRIPVSDSTVFSIASVSKEFTAYCILLLEKQGKLSLHDEIHKYLPQLPVYSAPIFINDLLHHTSGLRDYVELLALSGWGSEDIMSLDDVLYAVYRQKGLNFLPHTKYHYSNTNYLLLAEIVKKISGQTLSEYANTNIFEPLRMNRTMFNESFRNTVPNLAVSYHSAGKDNFRRVLNNYAFTGPLGVYSIVSDLSKWITYIIGLYHQNDPLYQKMIMLEKLPAGETNNYASGFFISNKYNAIPMIYHDGYDVAYRAYMACFPSEGLGFILLSNNDAVNPKYYGGMIADMLIKNKVQKDTTVTFREIKMDLNSTSAERRRLVATYEMEGGFVFEIRENKDVLNVILDGEAFRLYPQLNGEWSVKEFDYNIFLKPNNTNGELAVRGNGEIKKGFKVELVKLDSKEATKYMGKYYSDEVSQNYDVKLVNSKLVVSHFKQGDYEMKPFTKDIFKSGGGFFDTIRFERSANGEVIGFTYLGERAM